jgi:hypothetical protein
LRAHSIQQDALLADVAHHGELHERTAIRIHSPNPDRERGVYSWLAASVHVCRMMVRNHGRGRKSLRLFTRSDGSKSRELHRRGDGSNGEGVADDALDPTTMGKRGSERMHRFAPGVPSEVVWVP